MDEKTNKKVAEQQLVWRSTGLHKCSSRGRGRAPPVGRRRAGGGAGSRPVGLLFPRAARRPRTGAPSCISASSSSAWKSRAAAGGGIVVLGLRMGRAPTRRWMPTRGQLPGGGADALRVVDAIEHISSATTSSRRSPSRRPPRAWRFHCDSPTTSSSSSAAAAAAARCCCYLRGQPERCRRWRRPRSSAASAAPSDVEPLLGLR